MKERLDEINRIKELMGLPLLTEQEEEINTTHDRTYDYKKDDTGYYFRRKGSGESGWKKSSGNALNAIKTRVFGDDSSSKQTTSSDKPKNIKGFQQWVINTKGDKSILGKGGDSGYGDDGKWGKNTANAWNKYGREYKNKEKESDNDDVYTKLKNNSTPENIAKAIKDSYGGKLGNDKEALAQSAFEAITDKATYEKVKSELGQDPYKFVKDFMDTDEDYHNNGKTIDGEYKRLFGDVDYVDLSWVSNVSPQVRKQVMHLKENGFDKGKFTIVDDKNSKVYAINDDFSLYKSYNVVTGKNRGEAKEVVKTNAVDTLKNKWSDAWDKMFDDGIQSAFDYVKKCYIDTLENVKETPSGIFRRSGVIWNAIQDKLLTTFAENIYGKAYIGWKSLDGKTIPFGFHGTQNKARLDAMDPSNMKSCRRKMSYGCINFREQDILDINDFISSGDYSFWLSDDGKTILPWNG